ncbi:MAG: response regulator, partial [Alteraurantiacibacter sp.]|nr:response regulator [Alteraurantiacibacter sp.]
VPAMARVLVVDDDDIVAELVSEILISAGHACALASNAGEARKLLGWHRPDLLLLGDNLPGQGSSGLLRQLCRSPDLYDLPVIMLGSHGNCHDCMESGQVYVCKPVSPHLLKRRIEQVLKKSGEHHNHRKRQKRAAFQLQDHENDRPHQVFI